jgi:hypothetical protein
VKKTHFEQLENLNIYEQSLQLAKLKDFNCCLSFYPYPARTENSKPVNATSIDPGQCAHPIHIETSAATTVIANIVIL